MWAGGDPGRAGRPGRRPVVNGDDHPVIALVGDRLPEQPGVERRQSSRVGAVEHDMVQASEHDVSMTGAVRVWAPAALGTDAGKLRRRGALGESRPSAFRSVGPAV
jgi:hypothetical protein